jgi:hypothetical protein
MPREDLVADFSGAGPTPDGRIKPDLLAPGESVLSAAAGVAELGSCAVVWPGGYCSPRHQAHCQPSSLESSGTL